ncbi:hypothetical protein ACJ73_08698 [Blastomyces percursus]|uniref:Uncharacterized protein n=1 Tax=Blastomyces percursus TaxID=1658174 RepID=A0A1J9QR58_9EURO|nr:hypothetical protein ACJ73_08698 [Blastomyces percursus]
MGFIRTTKRPFWQLFDTAWKEAVTSSNIEAAFATTGLHPFDPERVLKKLQIRPCTPPDTIYQPRTPTSIVGLRKLVKRIKQQQHQISRENLALDKEILLIESRQFQKALNQERRRRKRGRAMGLLDPSNPSLAQFFSPAKVQSIRENLAASEAAKKDEQARKEDAKLQRTILKEQKEADIIQQRMEREAARQVTKQQKEMDKAARAAQRQIDKELRDEKKAQEQKEKEERAAVRLQSRLNKKMIEESKNHLPNRESRPSISQRVAKSRFQSPARVPTDPPPEGYDDIVISTNLMAACSLNLPPPKISRSGRVIKPTKHLQDYLYIFISPSITASALSQVSTSGGPRRINDRERVELACCAIGLCGLYMNPKTRREFKLRLQEFCRDEPNLSIQNPERVLYRMEKNQRFLNQQNEKTSGTAWSETDLAQALDEWIEIVDGFRQEREQRQAEEEHTERSSNQ